MAKRVLTEVELFKTLIEYSINGMDWDLHNNYDCSRILISNKNLTLQFLKKVDSKELPEKVEFLFNDIQLIESEIVFGNDAEMKSIEDIYRGRAEIDSELVDNDKQGRNCYYINFVEGTSIELFAKEVIMRFLEDVK